MKKMKRIIALGIFLFSLVFINCVKEQYKKELHETEIDEATEIPRLAFKLLIDSTLDPCPICVKKLEAEAFSILNRKYRIGRTIKGDELCRFTRIKECGPNEFVLSTYMKREPYFSAKDKSERQFPLLVFRFYTKSNRLVGISGDAFTEGKYSRIINSSPHGSLLKGEIEIIRYQYGDGPTYNYFPKKNQLLVHCRILVLEK